MLEPPAVDTLVVGCGNALRGDDGAGPAVLRELAERGLPPGVRLLDAGTRGMDVAFAMRDVRRVVVVDASQVGAEPGAVHRVPADELVGLAPPEGNMHLIRWDQALGFARWLLEDDYPTDVIVYLVEGASFEAGAPLSTAVDAAVQRIADTIEADLREDLA